MRPTSERTTASSAVGARRASRSASARFSSRATQATCSGTAAQTSTTRSSSASQPGGLRSPMLHPHCMVEWARAFACPILIHESDRKWADAATGRDAHDQRRFTTSTAGAALARSPHSALLTGDIVHVIPDRYVGFMYSYPNVIPLRPRRCRRSAQPSSRTHSTRSTAPWWGNVVEADGSGVVRHELRPCGHRSPARLVAAPPGAGREQKPIAHQQCGQTVSSTTRSAAIVPSRAPQRRDPGRSSATRSRSDAARKEEQVGDPEVRRGVLAGHRIRAR